MSCYNSLRLASYGNNDSQKTLKRGIKCTEWVSKNTVNYIQQNYPLKNEGKIRIVHINK